MPTIVRERDLPEPDGDSPREQAFKVTSPEGAELLGSPDEACELICDLVAEQFWDWQQTPSRPPRFKPRVRVLEVW